MNKEMVDKLYNEDRKAVRKVLHAMEEDWDIVDDLMQDVYLRAIESEYDERSTQLTWLCGIAKNVGKMHVRAQSRDKRKYEVLSSALEGVNADEFGAGIEYHDRTDLSSTLREGTEHLDPMLEAEAASTYKYLLRNLPPSGRMMINMRREGATFAEVAEQLGLAEKTVRNMMSMAYKFIREDPEATATNSILASDNEHKFSLLDWANRATKLCKRASMDDVVAQQLKRFKLADTAIRLRWERIYD